MSAWSESAGELSRLGSGFSRALKEKPLSEERLAEIFGEEVLVFRGLVQLLSQKGSGKKTQGAWVIARTPKGDILLVCKSPTQPHKLFFFDDYRLEFADHLQQPCKSATFVATFAGKTQVSTDCHIGGTRKDEVRRAFRDLMDLRRAGAKRPPAAGFFSGTLSSKTYQSPNSAMALFAETPPPSGKKPSAVASRSSGPSRGPAPVRPADDKENRSGAGPSPSQHRPQKRPAVLTDHGEHKRKAQPLGLGFKTLHSPASRAKPRHSQHHDPQLFLKQAKEDPTFERRLEAEHKPSTPQGRPIPSKDPARWRKENTSPVLKPKSPQTTYRPKPKYEDNLRRLARSRSPTPPPSGPVGLENLGNTCYMNSSVQVMLALKEVGESLANFALQLKELGLGLATNLDLSLTEGSPKDSPESPNDQGPSLMRAFIGLRRHTSSEHPVKALVSMALQSFKDALASKSTRFQGYEQQDAWEMMGILLDSLRDEVLQCLQPKDGMSSQILDTVAQLRNPMDEWFGAEMVNVIICLNPACSFVYHKPEMELDLKLEIPAEGGPFRDGEPSVQDLLDLAFVEEELEYKCGHCGHRRARTQRFYRRAPKVLVLAIKRYDFGHGQLGGRKIHRPIRIRPFLSLRHISEAAVHVPPPTAQLFPVPKDEADEDKAVAADRDATGDVGDAAEPEPAGDKWLDSDSCPSTASDAPLQALPRDSGSESPAAKDQTATGEWEEKPAETAVDERPSSAESSARAAGGAEAPLEEEAQPTAEPEEEPTAESPDQSEATAKEASLESPESKMRRRREELRRENAEVLEARFAALSRRRAELGREVEQNEESGVLGGSYRLVGVVSHMAYVPGGLRSGHYVAEARDSSDAHAPWRTFDDLRTSPTDFAEIADKRASNSYVFVYRHHGPKP